ncbi:MAG: transporter permease [Paenibacillus sp.]|nr:transporter permease [Paenibacillus sp.]
MKTLMVRSITWKMAWRNIRSQPRQTLLTILGGCVGAALVMAAVIFFQSFDESGNRWLKAHYGPLDWEMRPANHNTYFTADELPPIKDALKHANMWSIPAITVESTVTKLNGELQPIRSVARNLVIGINFKELEAVDPANPLWSESLSPDQVVLSSAAASQLEISSGDIVRLSAADGTEHLFQVAMIVSEQGITGYRGLTASAGTLLMQLDSARRLAAIPEHSVTSFLAGAQRSDGQQQLSAPHFPVPSTLFEVAELKQLAMNQVQQLKGAYGIPFALCSLIAIFAGTLLMVQILLMLADARKGTIAILRAIGFHRRQTQRIFFVETMLLNLLITGIGLVIGILLGVSIIGLYNWFHSDLMSAYSTYSIPIYPYISYKGVLFSGAAVLILLSSCSILACYWLGKHRIVAAMRGDSQLTSERSHLRRRNIRIVLTASACVILTIHVLQLMSGNAVEVLASGNHPFMPQGLIVILLWLASSVASLYIAVQCLPLLQKLLKPVFRLASIDQTSQFLAFRYPTGKYRRTLIVALLFSCCFMLLTFILIINEHSYRNLKQKSYTVLDYHAFIKYDSETEKQEVLALIQKNPDLAKLAPNPSIMEPYMLQTHIQGVEPNAQLNLITPNEAFLLSGTPKLLSRSSKFATDEEAWMAVKNDPRYVIWDKKYSYGPEEWPEMFSMNRLVSRKLIAGDKLELIIYEKPDGPKPLDYIPKQAGIEEVEIAGFVDTNTGMQFYNVVFANELLYDKFKKQGYRWEYLTEKGYIMLDMTSPTLTDIRKAEELFTMQGIKGFIAPALTEGAKDLGSIQMMWMLVGFMALSVCIGLAGLAILQLRAVQERAKTFAMLRCMGFSKRMIRQMMLLEGTSIGWIGLLNGVSFGSIGGYFIVNYMEYNKPPTAVGLSFQYPWQLLIPITAVFLLLTWLLNLLPPNSILRLSPGEAIRSADETAAK